MDYRKLVISLVLIVCGTTATLGSPIKDNYPEENSKEYTSGEKLKEFHSDPDLDKYPEMDSNRKKMEALPSDKESGNFPEMAPNPKELEALLMRSNQSNPLMEKDIKMIQKSRELKDLLSISSDENKEEAKRVEPGTVIAATALTANVLKSVLDSLGNVQRKIAIGISNKSYRKWTAINAYYYSGTSDVVLPRNIYSDQALVYGARKTSGPVATGAVGVMAYCIPNIYQTLAVMFSVPFDYNLYGNWWNVKLLHGYDRADYNMFYEMYYRGSPFRGDDAWHSRNLGYGLKFSGSMSSSGTPTLEIHVELEDGYIVVKS